MSKKIWNLKFVCGNPKLFSQITSASDNPMTKAKALEGFDIITANGWRVWIEHAQTGRRIAESDVERDWRVLSKTSFTVCEGNTDDKQN